ncbi:hypothetical protein EK21DRAFT_83754 [Setomelanomma holmii]|uniref:Uncharacterized protein n=1 Tax=Setomelanomma holmii TaxID=210430 RepID=A0A9P4HKG7_9PLEO|nr:hypothetical protein EK21DRAFT_83754 [Setomelanomma holmii]
MREANIAAHATAPDDSVYTKSLEVASEQASGLFGDGRQPRRAGTETDPGPQLHAATTQDHDANIASHAHQTEVAQASGRCGDVNELRTCETNVALRHCAAYPDDQHKHRNTHALAIGPTDERDEFRKRFQRHTTKNKMMAKNTNMATHIEHELEGLHTGNRISQDEVLDSTDRCIDDHEMYVALQDEDSGRNGELVATLSNDASMGNIAALTRWYESTPELNSDSESGKSFAEELQAPLLSLEAFGVQPMELNNRFGSFYSVDNQLGSHGFPTASDKNAAAEFDDAYRSRFSWGSSIYSDTGLEAAGEAAAWWTKPIKPLVVRMEISPPPPIPERNPLRLLRRASRTTPHDVGEKVRRSRNILNLRLDLSRSAAGVLKESVKSPDVARKRSKAVSMRKFSNTARRKPHRPAQYPHTSSKLCTNPERARQQTGKAIEET